MTRPSLHQVVTELAHPHTSRTRYDYDANGTRYENQWTVDHPSLLAQLWGSVDPTSQGGEVGSTTAGSKPAANIEALAAAADIDLAVSRWLTDLGEEPPLDDPDPRDPDRPLVGSGTVQAIRRLYALTASANRCDKGRAERDDTGHITCCAWHAIDHDMHRWWVRARVLTGWDSPAWKPNNTCPLCGERRTVVVRWSASIGTCTHCRETWDEDNIGLLADHIRAESEEERFRPAPAAPCGPAPELEHVYGRMVLCPDCGSRRCWKVLDIEVRPPTGSQRHAG